MFVNLGVINDKWVKENKAAFALFDNFGMGVAVISPDMKIIALNKVMKKWFPEVNVEKKPICYRAFNNPPRNEICSYCPTILALKDGKVHEVVTETPRPGGVVNFRVVSSPVRDKDGKIVAAIEVVEDVTENKRLNKEREESRTQQKAILDNIPDMAWLKDKESVYVAVNETFCRMFGVKPEEIVGKKDFVVASKAMAEHYIADDKEVIRTGKRKIIEEPTYNKDGVEILLETVKTPIFNDKGEVIGTSGIARDITLRKRLESQLKESEEKYRKLFEDANDAIFMIDAQTEKILDANKQAEKLLEIPKKELIGIDQTELFPPEEVERYKEGFRSTVKQATDSRDSHIPSINGEVLNASGEKIPVYINASILEIAGKKVVLGIFRDISELKRIESEKKEAEALALIDPHTQLYNYRYLQRRIHSEFELAKRRATPLSMMMVDIDYFKSINNTYGHEYGDAVLQEFAIVLQHACRGIDVVTRFEGEGFAIILPDTEEKGALAFAERMQRIIKKHRFGANKVKLRVSIGICSYPEYNIATVDHLLSNVDKCVRLAKDQGGDTIVVSSQLRKTKIPSKSIDVDSQRRVTTMTKKFAELIHHNKQNTIEAVYALAHTVGAKNAYTEEHSEEMVKLSTELGKKLNLTDQELEDVKHGAMLHDIGKLGISEKILLKRGKLTKKEFEIIKKHPQIGADIIRPVHFLRDVVPIILHHHERYDGYGYGAKLRGEEIPLGARIVAVVDVYQALVSNRPYRKAYSRREAIKIIREESGTHFDPKVVKAFMEVISKRKGKRVT